MSVSFLDKENVQLGPVRLCLHPIKLIRFEGNTTPIPHGHKRGVDKGGHEEKFLELPSVRARTKEALIGANGSWMPRNGLRSVAMMQPLVPSPRLVTCGKLRSIATFDQAVRNSCLRLGSDCSSRYGIIDTLSHRDPKRDTSLIGMVK
ncbi:hypothetical protein H4Q26_008746 [Puccinia striiformis f. sp. tritici PST-130]|nr:hypothetical protein H4Q26_008746 [Puccinia striiformis f. sp. tritici PST-130]